MSRKKPGGKGSSKGEWEAEVDPAQVRPPPPPHSLTPQVRFMHARIRPFFSDGKVFPPFCSPEPLSAWRPPWPPSSPVSCP